MDAGIFRALKTVKDNRYVQYVGLGLAGMVEQEDQVDKETGKRKRKSKYQLIRISAAVCGIELCYAAETAFVSPILLKLGVPASLMSMVWCLSPIIGFFLVPVMGSLSDRCRLRIGRRRPFIIVLSIGIIFGLALVPNGQIFGVFLGDIWNRPSLLPPSTALPPRLPLQTTTTTTPPTTTDFITTLNSNPVSFPRQNYNKQTFFNATSPSLLSPSSTSSSVPVKYYEEIDVPAQGDTFSSYYYKSGSHNPMQSPRNNNSTKDQNSTNDEPPLVSFSVPSEHLRGIILTILGVAMLDFNCDACQSPCRAYLLDVSVPEDHSQGLTMFTVMAGAGGAVGYVMGGIDWNSTSFGEAFGGHIRVVFTLVLFAFLVCMTSTLTSFKEIPLLELNMNEENLQSQKKKKDKKKYKKFTNEEDSSSENDDETLKGTPVSLNYGALSDTGKQNHIFVNTVNENQKFSPTNSVVSSKDRYAAGDEQRAPMNYSDNDSYKPLTISKDGSDSSSHVETNPFKKSYISDNGTNKVQQNYSVHDSKLQSERPLENGVHSNGHVCSKSSTQAMPTNSSLLDSDIPNEISPYTMRGDVNNQNVDVMPTIDLLEVSTDVTLRTYLRSIVRMPRCMWILCLTNLFCWMSLVCYSLYFTDFVGQAVFKGNPQSPVGTHEHNLYDEGIRLGSMGMSLYSLSCACYSLVIEKLVQRFRAKRVYVIGQLVYSVGMVVMSASRSKVAVILMSPTAGVMYATLFTMPYLVVAHYHARGMFSQSDTLGGEERQVRGLGTDVAIISSMVFLAQFLLSVFMGTAVSVLRSTTTVVVASSVLSLMGAITATQITYLDL